MTAQTEQQYLYSPAVQVTVNGSYAVGATQSWDAFMRQSYDQANQAISRQANLLLQRGNVTSQEESRSSVNRFAATVRVAGPAAIIIQITLSGVIIAQASPADRARVASGQAGSIAGGAAGGAGGAWAGCLAGAPYFRPRWYCHLWVKLARAADA